MSECPELSAHVADALTSFAAYQKSRDAGNVSQANVDLMLLEMAFEQAIKQVHIEMNVLHDDWVNLGRCYMIDDSEGCW